MDATKFTAMRPDGSGPSSHHSESGGLGALLGALNPKDMAVDAYTTLAAWTSLAVSQCFSKVRGRPQFDEEHQRSLLSCHTTEDDGFGSFPDEEAMLELRRRVQKVDLSTPARPMSFAQELEATYNRHKAMQTSDAATRPAPGASRQRREKAASADAAGEPELGALWSDTDRALNDILSAKVDRRGHQLTHRASDPGKAEDLRRLSVDELLALRVPSPTSTMSIPEKTGSDNDEASASLEGRELREWLQAIDASRASEFVVYARSFEQQGFLTLEDLAQLDENDVEQAMSEVGISKFAHRARIRKAILRLPLEGAVSESQFVQPALAG